MAAFRYDGEDKITFILMICFETLFGIDCIVNFMLSYEEEASDSGPTGREGKPVRELYKIGVRYMNNGLLQDLIPLIPFQLLPFENGRNNLLYLIKLKRL